MSHDLVTIRTDIQLDVTAQDMEVSCSYDPKVADLFEKYEFGSLRKYLGNVQPTSPKEEKHLIYKEVSPAELCRKAIENRKCAIVTEGDGPGIFSDISRIVAATGTGTECIVAEGNIEDFAKAVERTHGDSKYGREYKAMIELIKVKFGIEDEQH